MLLQHDYLSFRLTGAKVMEYGDANGTALLDVRRRAWSDAVLNAIDPDLAGKLLLLIPSDQPAGRLQAATAKALGLGSDVLVSAGLGSANGDHLSVVWVLAPGLESSETAKIGPL